MYNRNNNTISQSNAIRFIFQTFEDNITSRTLTMLGREVVR
jgi:hypothetical protein